MGEKGKIVGEVCKNLKEKYVFTVKTFKDTKYLDIRIYKRLGKDKKWKPTKKGITVSLVNRLSFLDGLYESLKKLS